MTAGPQMPEWPYSNLLDIDPDFYEQRILDCWEARCRLAVEALKDMESYGRYAVVRNALIAIGPLPEHPHD